MDPCSPLAALPSSADRPATAPAPEPTSEIAVVMAAIRAGDRSAIWRLRDLADEPVRSRLRAELRRLGARYDADDLDGMVVDAVLVIARLAKGWRDGGAPPWSWAHHRIVGVAHAFVGTFARSIEGFAADGGGSDDTVDWLWARMSPCTHPGDDTVDPGELGVTVRCSLARLADEHPQAAVLDEALADLVSERDAAIWLAVVSEQAAGNRHPALTVGTQVGLRADAVRKVVQRVRARLEQASRTERYRGLAGLACLAIRPDRGRDGVAVDGARETGRHAAQIAA